MKKYFKILALPIIAIVTNALLHPVYVFFLGFGGDIVFNAIRVLLWAFAGWRLASLGGFGIWKSALSGAILFFIDHPIIFGSYCLIEHQVEAFYGVLASYCIFWFVPVGIAAIGAAVGKRQDIAHLSDTTSDAASPRAGANADCPLSLWTV